MREVRVLEVITTPMRRDGLTLAPLRLAGRMARVRCDFAASFVADDGIRDAVEAAGGKLFVAPSRLRRPVRYVRFLARLIRENGYAIVHAHGNSCTLAIDLLAAKLGGARVRIAHSHNSACRYRLLHRLLRPLFDHLYTHAMACGTEAGRWLFPNRPFEIVRNPVDSRAFAFDPAARESVRAELGLGGEMAFGCVAGFVPAKNHAFLLDAFACALKRRPDCRLVLVGDGPLRAEIEAQAESLGIAGRVRFTGVRADVPRLLQGMDAMLLPSQFEGFPLVALEWQCAGLPAWLSSAVTRDCALTEGVRFLPLEPDRWADAIVQAKPIDRAAASAAGIRAVKEAGYDLEDAARSLEARYLELADGGTHM